MHFTLTGHISTGSQFTGQGPSLAGRQVWEVAEGLSSLQSPPTTIWSCRVDGARLQAALGRPFGNKGSETSCSPDSSPGLWVKMDPGGQPRAGSQRRCHQRPQGWCCRRWCSPCLELRREMEASSRGRLVPRWAGGKDSRDTARHYNAATSPYRRPGMATQTKTPTPQGRQGFFPDRNM